MSEQNTQTTRTGPRKLAHATLDMERENASNRFGRTANIVDRVLSDACDGAEVVQVAQPIPGWTDGTKVNINASALPPLIAEDGSVNADAVAVWMGINAHEVGHTMYTPRVNSPLFEKFKSLEAQNSYPGMRKLHNLVEDQRQERLVIARFAPWRTYLTRAAMRLIVEAHARDSSDDRKAIHDAMTIEDLWPLVAGRTWLPTKARALAREAWDKVHGAGAGDRLARLIGTYQCLPDPGYDDSDDALDVLFKIYGELKDLIASGQMPSGCVGVRSGDQGDHMSGDLPDVGDDAEGVPAAGSESDTAALDAEATKSKPKKGKGKGKAKGDGDGDGDGEDGDAAAGGGDGDGTDEGQAGAGSGGEADSETGPDAQGAGTSSSGHKRDAKLRQFEDALAQAAARQLVTDQDVVRDVENIKVRLTGRSRQTQLPPRVDETWKKRTVTPGRSTRHLANELADHFRRLVDETLPQWNRRVPEGKLNVKRYMLREVGDPLDDIFDRFQQGMQDETSLDVRVLLDLSGSMSSHLASSDGASVSKVQRASEAAWAIRRGVEAAEGDVTVYGYDTEAYMLETTGRRAKRDQVVVYPTGGGTDPSGALREVTRILPTVKARHKVVVAVTDGDWVQGFNTEAMTELAAHGAITIGVVLDPKIADLDTLKGRMSEAAMVNAKREAMVAAQPRLRRMACQYAAVMGDPHGMVPLFDKVVSRIMAQAIAGVR